MPVGRTYVGVVYALVLLMVEDEEKYMRNVSFYIFLDAASHCVIVSYQITFSVVQT